MKSQLAPYKYPRWIEFIDELPKTATGKIQRFKLRAKRSADRGETNAMQRSDTQYEATGGDAHEAIAAAPAPVARSPATASHAGADFARSAQQAKLKVGLMLPYTGTYAALGNAITNGFKLAIEENGGKLGGREIEYFTVDDESDPAKAPDNANKLIKRDKVDVLVGTVHSGVALAMVEGRRATTTRC